LGLPPEQRQRVDGPIVGVERTLRPVPQLVVVVVGDDVPHLSMLTDPRAVADVIAEAASAVWVHQLLP
jgi:pimeloyl-ACP methyl ester carboxylesterase